MANAPLPSLKNTETVDDRSCPTTRSGKPSWFRSPTATGIGRSPPAPNFAEDSNVPSPWLRNTSIAWSPVSATIRSRYPSPLTSPSVCFPAP